MLRFMTRWIPCLAAVWAVAGVVPAGAQEDAGTSQEREINISKGPSVPKIPLLLEEFQPGSGATPEDTKLVLDVLANDLEYSDLFTVTRVPPPAPGETPPATGANFRVRGTVAMAGGDLSLQGLLDALPGGSRVFSREYRTKPEWYREVAHRFADDIVRHLTDYPGVARTRIAFASNRTGNKEIFVVDYDGFGLRQVTHNGSINMSPAWSPDGGSLAYVSYKNGDPDIYILDLASGQDRRVAGGQGVQTAPAFSPDGKRLLYSQTSGQESEIYVCDVGGGGTHRVSRVGGINTSPSWSPDGRRMVFTSDRAGNPHLYISDVEGGSPQRITFDGTWNDTPCWSPDGERIVYVSRRDGPFSLALVDPAGRDESRRTFGPASDEHPSWAADGRHVAFSSTRGRGRGVYVMDVESGSIRTVLADGSECFGICWSPVPPR